MIIQPDPCEKCLKRINCPHRDAYEYALRKLKNFVCWRDMLPAHQIHVRCAFYDHDASMDVPYRK